MEIIVFTFFIIILIDKLNLRLGIENIILRQQLAIMKQSIHRPFMARLEVCPWNIEPKYLLSDGDGI